MNVPNPRVEPCAQCLPATFTNFLRRLTVFRYWMIAVCLLGALATSGRGAESERMTVVADQIAPMNSVIGPLAFSFYQYFDPIYVRISSSNEVLVPTTNITVDPYNQNITIQLAAGQHGSSGIQIGFAGNPFGATCNFTIEVPMSVAQEGGSANSSNLATRGIAFAKDVRTGNAAYTIPHLNDGIYGNSNSWAGNSANSFAGISFGSRAVPINQLAFGRDNTGVLTAEVAGRVHLEYTVSPHPDAATTSWSRIGLVFPPMLTNPALRHVVQFPTVMATGIRLVTEFGIVIDELELYNSTVGPMVVAPDHQLIPLHAGTAALPFTTSAEPLTITATSSNQSFIPNANIALGGTPGNRTVQLTPVVNVHGSTVITLTVSNGVQTASDSFTVATILPSVIVPPNQLIPLNTSTGVLPLTTSSGPGITITATSSNQSFIPDANIILGGAGSNRTVQATPVTNGSGTAMITLSISDGVQTVTNSFAVTTLLNLLEEGGTFWSGNLATGRVAFAKDVIPGWAEHTIPHLNDGFYSREKSWIAGSSNSFAGINLGAIVVPINCVAFGRDNTGVWTDRALDVYTVQYTTVPNPNASTPQSSWHTVGVVETVRFETPSDRHLLSFAGVNATGLRILTIANGTSIDELEIYNIVPAIVASKDVTLYQSPLQPLTPETTTYRISQEAGLTVSASSSNQTLVPNANIVLAGSGTNRTVTVNPAPTHTGSATITLTVSNGTQSTSDTFIVTVVPPMIYPVGNHASLVSAIQSANGSPVFSFIQLTGNITLEASLPYLYHDMVVDGGGFSINGAGHTAFVIGDAGHGYWTPDVTLKDLSIHGAKAVGGNSFESFQGGSGGGGGGFGGAVFVSFGAKLRLQNANLFSNRAQGGSVGVGYVSQFPQQYAGTAGGYGIGSSTLGNATAGDGGAAGLGFGGGGGGSDYPYFGYFGRGGNGGYGGGGGGGYVNFYYSEGADPGGFGGSPSVYTGYAMLVGGGGAGLGGGVFIQTGGTLLITGSTGLSGNLVTGGASGWGANTYGSTFGNGIFGHGLNTITFNPETASFIQLVADVIADETGSGGGGVGATGRLSVLKQGPGTTLLSGANTYAGTTTIEAGRLLLTGSKSNAIINQAVFGPYGVATTTGAFSQSATGSLQVRLGSTSDRLDAASVNLNGSLDIILGAGAPATPITIINNTGAAPVTGTFTGLAEGAIFVNNGKVFGISYVGGTGNDVVLRVTPPFVVTGDGGSTTTSNLATRGVAFAKDFLPGFANHTIPHLNDGIYGNANSWIGNSANSFAGISFGSRPILINQVAFGRDNTGVWSDRALGTYTIQFTTVANPNASTPDNSWTTVGTIDTATLPNPALRHVFNLPTLLVTGIRVIAAVHGIAIDELEVYNSTTGLMVTAPDHQTVAVDTSTAALPFTTSADSNLTFSASSDNPALIPAANIIFGGTAGNRTVILTPLAGRTGVASITLTISNGVETASDSFLLTVPTNTSVTGLFGFGLHMEAANNTAGMPNLALVANGGSAFAQDVIPIAPHQISCLNDGLYGNPNSWVGNSTSSFAGINLGSLKMVNRVAFGRDNTGVLADSRWNGIYTIQYTTVANPDANTVSWTTVGVIDRGYAPYFLPPSILRQLFSFPPVMATGVRILTVAAAGSPNGLGIDELEIYNVTGPDIIVEQVAYKPLLPGVSTLNYGSVVQLSASTIQLTITNPGTANLELGTISKTGANPADFTFGTLGTTTLLPGTSTTLALTFAPGALGARHASLSIASNATGVKTNFNFYATGTGVSFTSPAGGISSGLTLVETGGTFAAGNLASAVEGGSAFAKDVIPGFAAHTIAHLNDGVYGNANSWINNSANSFGGINLGGLKRFDRIAFGRNNAIPQTTIDRATGLYSLQYTTVPNPDATTTNWTTIGTVDLGNAALFGTEASGGPAKRHLFSFTPVQATGMRIVTVVDGSCIDEIEVYPYFTPQELWRQSHFSTTADTGQAADGADADSDGELNLLEYATGQNPNAASRAGLSVVREASILNITYPRNIAAMNSGVTFIVETSDTLSADSWTTTSVSAPAILSDNGTTQQIQVSVPSNVQRRFVRLRVFN